MSETETETGEHAGKRTAENHECRRCGRAQGLVGKYDVWLCRQCFREIARDMGFKKYS
jgi:small subunit ribosomal protein S14